MDRDQMESTLRTGIEEAAIRAKVPRYNTSAGINARNRDPGFQKVIDERHKLNQQLSTIGEKMNKKDKEAKLQRLTAVNEEIFQLQQKETEKRRRRQLKT